MKIKCPMKKAIVNGTVITFYSIGWLAAIMQRSTATIRRWQRKNVLPTPTFKIEGARRYYCAAEIQAYTQFFQKARVRTSVPIEATPFQTNCREWKENFKNRYKDVPLAPELPNHKELEVAMTVKRIDGIRKEVQTIVGVTLTN